MTLNDSETHTLRRMAMLSSRRPYWIIVEQPSQEFRQAIDMLILSGLAERRADPRFDGFGPSGWLNEWRLTEAGIEAANYKPQTSLFAP